MTVDLGTCVGSPTRQIVVARVLLTATVPPALPGGSVSEGWLAPPSDVITHCLRSDDQDWHLPGDGPNKARQFTGDRGGDDSDRLAAAGELAIARAQPQLGFPGDRTDRLGLALLPRQQLAAEPRRKAVGPRRLDQQ